MNQTRFTAFYDACVLYPAPLRDILMQLALVDIFHARWSNQVHEEWIRNLLDKRKDLSRDSLENVKNLMNKFAPDALVEGYEFLIDKISLPDPEDRHVLAAAYHGRSDVIVTYNLKDFPEEILSEYRLTAQHPDEFLLHTFGINPIGVLSGVKTVRNRLKNPPISIEKYIATLEKRGLEVFSDILRKNSHQI